MAEDNNAPKRTHAAVENQDKHVKSLKKSVEVARKTPAERSDVVGTPEWSEKAKSKAKSAISPKQY